MKDQSKKITSAETPQPEHEGEVLAKLPASGFDTQLEQAPDSPPVKGLSGLRKQEGKQKKNTPPTSTSFGASEDKLALTDGALVSMRRSGGFRFTLRTVTVYQDGTVAVEGKTLPGGEAATPRKLRDKELAKLYRLLDSAGFPSLPAVSGYQSPDGMAYEIAAHIDQAIYNIEVFDGSIPEQVAPLIQALTGYMRSRPSPAKPKPPPQ